MMLSDFRREHVHQHTNDQGSELHASCVQQPGFWEILHQKHLEVAKKKVRLNALGVLFENKARWASTGKLHFVLFRSIRTLQKATSEGGRRNQLWLFVVMPFPTRRFHVDVISNTNCNPRACTSNENPNGPFAQLLLSTCNSFKNGSHKALMSKCSSAPGVFDMSKLCSICSVPSLGFARWASAANIMFAYQLGRDAAACDPANQKI
jgi:hypothetical protein